jgi:hypothetical protein
LDQVFGLAELLKSIALYMLWGMKELILYSPVIITDIMENGCQPAPQHGAQTAAPG